MPARLHPGVYVEEVPGGARSIEGASTSTAIFVGETERGPTEATRIKGLGGFRRLFGGHLRDGTNGPERCPLAYAMEGFFQNGGRDAYVLRAIDASAADTAGRTVDGSLGQDTVRLVASSPGEWGNRVGVEFLVSTDGDANRFRVAVLYAPPGGTFAANGSVVEVWDRLSTDPGDENFLVDVLRRSNYVRWDESLAPDRPAALDSNDASITESGVEALDTGGLSGGSGGDADLAAGDYPAALARLDGVTDASLFVMPGKVGGVYEAGFAYVLARRRPCPA